MNKLLLILKIPPEVAGVSAVSLLYLLYDIYPAVKSFRAMLNTASFLLLWFYFAISTGIAYGFLMTSAVTKIQSLVGTALTKLTVIVMAAFAAATIFQSLSLKISEVKIINVEDLIDSYRRQVLADILKKSAQMEKLKAMRLADKLCKKFENDIAKLKEMYADALTYSSRPPASIVSELENIEQEAAGLKLSPVRLIAGRLTRLDPARFGQLLKS